jgi:hypothetical protein
MSEHSEVPSIIEDIRDKLSLDYGADLTAEFNRLAAIIIKRKEAIGELLIIAKNDPGFLIEEAIMRALMLSGKHGIDAACKLLNDINFYQKVARVIDNIKYHGDPNIKLLINAKLEELHEQGVPVRIQEAESIDVSVLLEIRNFLADGDNYVGRNEIFPRMRLGIIKCEYITLRKLTQEFGLRYREKLYQEIDRETAEGIMCNRLYHNWGIRYEYSVECPSQQIQDVISRFLQYFESFEESSIRYYTYNFYYPGYHKATLKYDDDGVLIIGATRAGCFWLEAWG